MSSTELHLLSLISLCLLYSYGISRYFIKKINTFLDNLGVPFLFYGFFLREPISLHSHFILLHWMLFDEVIFTPKESKISTCYCQKTGSP